MSNRIQKTLHLLVMLDNSTLNDSDTKETAAKELKITRQFIIDAGLTLPEFTNSVRELSDKGYLWHFVLFDDELRTKIKNFKADPQYDKSMEQLKVLDTYKNSEKLKSILKSELQRIAPHGYNVDETEFKDLDLSFSTLASEGLEHIVNMGEKQVATIFPMPFRNLQKLLNKLEEGLNLNEIVDDGFWYDKDSFIFYIDGAPIKTSRRNKPNLEHTVLFNIFSDPSITVVEYEYMIGFDPSVGNEAYQDAMRRFVKKHPKLKSLFTPHKYTVDFHPERHHAP